tara:strand:+ start:266 stop:1672 length:1407 start_codon:yes stop_codon:yes gene_type:complete
VGCIRYIIKACQKANIKKYLNFQGMSGFFRPGKSNRTSIEFLLADFINDRDSKSLLEPFYEKKLDLLANCQWGEEGPLEKVVRSNNDLKEILKNPKIYKNSICIIEPAKHVGTNPKGNEVKASINIAYLSQYIADCDSILIPLWETGPLNKELLIELITSCTMCFIEGGYPTLKDYKSFDNENINLEDLQDVAEEIILSRDSSSSPAIFICLGHQLAAQAHIELIKRATDQILSFLYNFEGNNYYIKNLRKKCEEIILVGENLCIYKDEKIVANGWNHECFAVALNLKPEVGKVDLERYSHSGLHPSDEFSNLLMSHELSHEHELGIVEKFITYEKNLHIEMFHSDVVNQEAILFANWAFGELHKSVYPIKKKILMSEISWILNLPTSVEIVCSTRVNGEVCTEVAATCINYLDYQTQKIRKSFTFQFHPELLEDLSTFHKNMPDFKSLKDDDGIRLLSRVMYQMLID